MSWYGDRFWKPYVPVGRRKANATKQAQKIAKKENRSLQPINITGKAMATTFWGKAWCENLERYSDFSNRLPRGRTYARNGSIVDLQISTGSIKALVAGSDVYKITIKIKPLTPQLWKSIKQDCSHSIASLIDLLQARFDQGVMQRITQPNDGLFPDPKQIEMSCSCPDWAGLCKHLAAVMYGVGNRLDVEPAMLFKLRSVDHLELVDAAASNLNRSLDTAARGQNSAGLAESDLSELFGIELDSGNRGEQASPVSGKKQPTKKAKKVAAKPIATVAKKEAAKKTATKKISKPTPAKQLAKQPPIQQPAIATEKLKRSAKKRPAKKLAKSSPLTKAKQPR